MMMLQSLDSPTIRGSTRLEAYSDAIFSIVATVMIIPIAHTEISEEEDLNEYFVHTILPKLVVYGFSFLVICHVWADHVWLFESVSKVDDLLVLLNLALMMVITFLPFSFTLLASYQRSTLALLLFCGTVIIVGCIQAVFIGYAFRNQELLRSEVRESPTWRSQRNKMLASVLTPVIIAVISAILTPISAIAANVSLLMILFGNFFRRTALKIYAKLIGRCRHPELEVELEASMRHKLLTETVTKERIACFSDGVFAIVSTLIILDICESNVPSKNMVEQYGSLAAALNVYTSTFLAYAGTFVTVGLLWYVHHSLLHYVREINKLMNIFNNLCLLCIGGMPLAFKTVTQFNVNKQYKNETTSIEFNCVVIFLAGLAQCSIWIAGLFSRNELILPEGRFNGKDHVYMTIKLAVYPLISFIVYWVTFAASYEVETEAFNAMQIGTLGVFILLRVFYSVIKKFQSRQISRSGLDINPIDSEVL